MVSSIGPSLHSAATGAPLADAASATRATSDTTSTPVQLSPVQEQLLRGLSENGGACAYNQLARVAYGLRKQDLPNADRSRLAVSLRHLESRGFVTLKRRWGTLGYGQPELVQLTDLGRTYGASFSRN
jgi:hypothetical protein